MTWYKEYETRSPPLRYRVAYSTQLKFLTFLHYSTKGSEPAFWHNIETFVFHRETFSNWLYKKIPGHGFNFITSNDKCIHGIFRGNSFISNIAEVKNMADIDRLQLYTLASRERWCELSVEITIENVFSGCGINSHDLQVKEVYIS